MIRMVLASDPHADWKTYGVSRLVEVERAMFQAAAYAGDPENEVDVFAMLGDLCDPEDGMAVARAARMILGVHEQATRYRRPGQAEREAIYLTGNHDTFKDGSGESTLSFFDSVPSAILYDRAAFVPGWRDDYDLLVFPYTEVGFSVDFEEWIPKAAQARRSKKTLVLSHLGVEGIQPGEETREMARGREVLLPRMLIGKHFPGAVIFNGHYHSRQLVTFADGPPVQVVGTPVQVTAAEESHEPGFIVVTLE